jgi:excisionase family DNA binding protein
VQEAADELGVDHRTVRKLCEQGRLPCVDVSTKRGIRKWKIPRDKFETYLEGGVW